MLFYIIITYCLRIKRYGTRTEVMNGKARMTQGRLTKDDFTYNEYDIL